VRWLLKQGDCVEVMRSMPEASIDAVICDPPYGLEFMGKEFDKLGKGAAQREWHKQWAVEALRVLKPGGHAACFGGTRTSHHLASALEEVGFEIRDSISVHGWTVAHLDWTYGTGFPKSLNVGKSIDKAAGAEREVVGRRTDGRHAYAFNGTANRPTGGAAGTDDAERIGGFVSDKSIVTAPATEGARKFEGWGTALKPAHEPIILARKPLIGTVAKNVLRYGTGALNIDACRVATTDSLGGGRLAGPTNMGQTCGGPEWDRPWMSDPARREGYAEKTAEKVAKAETLGRWPANLILLHHPSCGEQCVPGCPVAEMDAQSGASKSTGGRIGNKDGGGIYGGGKGLAGHYEAGDPGFGDAGGASRFFYCAKASKAEREAGCEGLAPEKQDPIRQEGAPGGDNPRNRGAKKRLNNHPTVKPVAVMKWLVDLLVGGRSGAVVLDPFAGSGTTGLAALQSGVRALLIESDPHYCDIARARMDYAVGERAKAQGE
jgi:site-specific DNA-methyltransferase (adenine-specific)